MCRGVYLRERSAKGLFTGRGDALVEHIELDEEEKSGGTRG